MILYLLTKTLQAKYNINYSMSFQLRTEK